MMTSSIYGLATTPATLADERGNSVIVSNTSSPQWLETLLRPVCTAMGCSAGFSSRPLTGRQVKEVGVGGSLSLAWRIGRAVMQVRGLSANNTAWCTFKANYSESASRVYDL